MGKFTDSMAWLAKRDGTLVIGHGPFDESSAPKTDGASFYVQDFALQDPKPWKTPSRVERTSVLEFREQLGIPDALHCDWTPMDAAAFSLVFQEVMGSINGGNFEKTVPVVTETGSCSTAPGAAIIGAMIRRTAPLHTYGNPRTRIRRANPRLQVI
jgi:menaquinone-specific isochorismate synthase